MLNCSSVLILNKNWQAINTTTPVVAISLMFTNSATGIQIEPNKAFFPLSWNEWIKLDIEDKDKYIQTPNYKIKIPKIILLNKFDKIPKMQPKFTIKNLWERDRGICQYTGKKLSKNEGNIDHVIPKSKGGKTNWSNCVLCHKDINSKKGNQTPKEAGLKLQSMPTEPSRLPSTLYIKNPLNIEEWDIFLYKK